jgi:hypothetical protein
MANSHFALAYNPSVPVTVSRRSRIPVPCLVTQSQDSTQEPDAEMADLPSAVPSHGTVESCTFRRYLLEDIMSAPVNESWVLLVSCKHPFYDEYLNVARLSSPLPLKYIREVPFIQIKAKVTVNCQFDDLRRGLMSKSELQRLLFGNGNGAVILEFAEARLSLQVLWRVNLWIT